MKYFSIFIFLFLNSLALFAGDNPPNRCAFFSIMISNNTNSVCKLVEKEIIYGKISSSEQVPALIPSGSSSVPFEMKQLLAGPEILLTFECGKGNIVSFRSKQGYCAVVHGDVKGTVLSSDNLSAKYSARNGSYLWNERGEISWIIESK